MHDSQLDFMEAIQVMILNFAFDGNRRLMMYKKMEANGYQSKHKRKETVVYFENGFCEVIAVDISTLHASFEQCHTKEVSVWCT